MYYLQRNLVSILLLVVCIVAFCVSGLFKRQPTDLEARCSDAATGRVDRIDIVEGGEIPVFDYKAFGTLYTMPYDQAFSAGTYKVDQEVALQFNPANPNEFRIVEKHPPTVGQIVCWTLGILFLLGDVGWTVYRIRKYGL